MNRTITIEKNTTVEVVLPPYFKNAYSFYKLTEDGLSIQVSKLSIRLGNVVEDLKPHIWTFQRWLELKGVSLKVWQELAANELLRAIHKHRDCKGKSFLLKHLCEFIDEHGNDYSVE